MKDLDTQACLLFINMRKKIPNTFCYDNVKRKLNFEKKKYVDKSFVK